MSFKSPVFNGRNRNSASHNKWYNVIGLLLTTHITDSKCVSCSYVIHRKTLIWNNLQYCNKTMTNLGHLLGLNEKVGLIS